MAKKQPAQPLAVMPGGEDENALMGRQLTEQYERAIGGMREVLIFGAMMLQLREKHPELAQKGNPKLQMSTRGHLDGPKPVTLQKWLETYAPKVKRTTALRFLHVTESVATEYAAIVGAKVAKQFSLSALVTTPADKLPAPAAAKQLSLFDFVTGTSQRSWLDRFAPPKPTGGKTYERGDGKGKGNLPEPTPQELAELAENEITELLNGLDAWLSAAHHTRITPDLRTTADAALEEARKKIRAVK